MASDAETGGDIFSQKAVNTFKACARVPTASKAYISPAVSGKIEVEVTWTQREIERGKKISYSRSYFVEKTPEGLKKSCESSCHADTTNV